MTPHSNVLDGNYSMWHMSNGWWMGGFLMMVLFGLLIWALVSFSSRSNEDSTREPVTHQRKPLEILEERYARGELSDEEFDRMRLRLGAAPTDSEN